MIHDTQSSTLDLLQAGIAHLLSEQGIAEATELIHSGKIHQTLYYDNVDGKIVADPKTLRTMAVLVKIGKIGKQTDIGDYLRRKVNQQIAALTDYHSDSADRLSVLGATVKGVPYRHNLHNTGEDRTCGFAHYSNLTIETRSRILNNCYGGGTDCDGGIFQEFSDALEADFFMELLQAGLSLTEDDWGYGNTRGLSISSAVMTSFHHGVVLRHWTHAEMLTVLGRIMKSHNGSQQTRAFHVAHEVTRLGLRWQETREDQAFKDAVVELGITMTKLDNIGLNLGIVSYHNLIHDADPVRSANFYALPSRMSTGTEEEWWHNAPYLGVIMSGTLGDRFGFSLRLSPSTTLEFVNESELVRRRFIATPVYDAILLQAERLGHNTQAIYGHANYEVRDDLPLDFLQPGRNAVVYAEL